MGIEYVNAPVADTLNWLAMFICGASAADAIVVTNGISRIKTSDAKLRLIRVWVLRFQIEKCWLHDFETATVAIVTLRMLNPSPARAVPRLRETQHLSIPGSRTNLAASTPTEQFSVRVRR